MFTRCSNHDCETVYRVTADLLRTSMGMVRCEKCTTVFNALSTIMESDPNGEAIDVVNHLKLTEHGDRIVMHPESLAARGWIRNKNAKVEVGNKTNAEDTKQVDTSSEPQDSEEERPSPTPASRDPLAAEEENMPPISSLPKSADGGLLPNISLKNKLLDFLPSLTDLQHATRNLLRHRKRSAMGLITIVFGVTALLQAGGFIEWSNWTLRESTIQSQLGHIQLVRPDYFEIGESDPYSFLFPGDLTLPQEIEALPEVALVSPRLAFTGLVSFNETSIPFKGEGVMDEKEREISKRLTIIQGDNISSVENGVIMGKGLAENLGVTIGDSVVILATTERGMNAIELTVAGIFQTASKPFDDASLRIGINNARTLLRVDGAHSYVISLHETEKTDQVVKHLRSHYAGVENIEFVPWIDLADFYRKVVVLFSAQVNLVRFIIALIIVIGISNTLIMSVGERTSEIGTLMAVGLKRSKILAMFMNEGAILGIMGGVIGALIGWGLSLLISHIGIPMPPSPGMDFSYEGEILVTWSLAIGGVLLGVIATVLASVYPARKASRLEIVDALRHSK